MGFREAIQNPPATLTESERRIGAILLSDRQGAPLYTASQLAEKADVHESTVVRFAQKLGYPGYLALRLDLASDVLGGGRGTGRPHPTGEEASLARVIRGQVDVLRKVEDYVSQDVIDEGMAAVIEARCVFLVGSGLVGPIADFFSRKLTLLGIVSIVVNQTGAELVHRLATVGVDDIALFFVLSSDYDAIQPLERRLMSQGTKVMLISDQPVLISQPQADFVLAVPRSDLHHGVFVALAAVAYAMDYSLEQQLAIQGGQG